MKAQRFDKAYIADFSETSEGYLTVKAPITRPGVFPYLKQDGGVEMEAKLPEELFSERTIKSANAKPVTDDHPTEAVTAANYSQYAKGLTHTDAEVRDKKLYISFTITDSATIKKVKDGKRELSIGFLADVSKENGEYEGMTYDSVQRNMEINHLAIVEKGRAGSTIAIRNDSMAYMIDSDDKNKKKKGGNKTMAKLVIDSAEFEVDSAVKLKVDALEAQLDAANGKVSGLDKLTGERDALKTQLAAKEKELSEAKKNSITADALDAAVEVRASLLGTATKFLGDSFEFKGKTDRAVKEAVITSVDATVVVADAADEYINAYFDSYTSMLDKKGFTKSALFVDKKDEAKENEEELAKKKLARLNLNKEGAK